MRLICCFLYFYSALLFAIEVELHEISVLAEASDAPFKEAGAVSYRGEDMLGQGSDTIVRTIAGTFTQHDIGQGGIAINIRGLEGMGRVNTQIDGVNQTFFQVNPAHGWHGTTTYVDENFIVGYEVERGGVAGASGVGSLGGVMNIRTIDPSDILRGRGFGMRVLGRAGNNGYGENGVVAGAYRFDFSALGDLEVLFAVSGKRKYGYKNGAGEQIASTDLDYNLPLESGLRSESVLNKWVFHFNETHELKFSHMQSSSRFVNNHSPMKVNMAQNQLEYRFNPLSDLLDVKARASYVLGKQDYLAKGSDYYLGKIKNPSFSFVLSNRSLFDFYGGEVALDYGVSLQTTRYNSNFDGLAMADGKQEARALFVDGSWTVGDFALGLALSWERYGISGRVPPTDDADPLGDIVFPKGGNFGFERQNSYFNPRLSLAWQATPWLMFYGNVGKSSRSANVWEVMYHSNYGNNPLSVNPYLRDERAFNREIGFNVFKNGVFLKDDALRLKVNYFHSRIKDYIIQDQFYLCTKGTTGNLRICDDVDDYSNNMPGSSYDTIGLYRNLFGTTRVYGYEIEGGYDAGFVYSNFSYSRTRSDIPHDYLADMGYSHVRGQPSYVWTLDFGTRLLDKKLVIGSRISKTGEDEIAGQLDYDIGVLMGEKIPANPVLIDIYARYQPRKNLTLFLNIDNLTNRVYNYPLSGGTLGTGNNGWSNTNQGTGRGRTFYMGFRLDL